jgi:hypothetical protein
VGDAVRIRRWLSLMRDATCAWAQRQSCGSPHVRSYRIVGRLAENRDQFYTFPGLGALVTDHMLAHIGAMHPRHLRSLLRIRCSVCFVVIVQIFPSRPPLSP